MSEPKTKPTTKSVAEFLNTIEDEQKRRDSFILLELFERITGEKAVMWGTSIVGFGSYHVKSEKSKQEVVWPLAGFSPRKQNLTLYVMPGNEDSQELLEKLGKHSASKACLYIKRLSDVDKTILTTLIEKSFLHVKKTYE